MTQEEMMRLMQHQQPLQSACEHWLMQNKVNQLGQFEEFRVNQYHPLPQLVQYAYPNLNHDEHLLVLLCED